MISWYLTSCPSKVMAEITGNSFRSLIFGTVLESVSLIVMRRHLRAVRSVSSEMVRALGIIS